MAYGPQPQISLAENPGQWNKAYGPNIFTIYNANEGTFDRYVLQIWDATNTNKLAEVRQLANLAGRAHFDVARILQNQMETHKYLENIPLFSGSEEETLEYNIKYGYTIQNETVVIQGEAGPYYCMAGRKAFNEELFEITPYTAEYNEQGQGLHGIQGPALMLTDFTHSVLKSSLTGGIPLEYNQPAYVDARVQKIRRNEYHTLSFVNHIKIQPQPSGDPFYMLNNRARVVAYNGNTEVYSQYIENDIPNGGGPLPTLQCEESDYVMEYPYLINTIQCGPDALGLPAGITHYYVFMRPSSYYTLISNCTPLAPATEIYRFDIDEGECSDFDPIQVSWANSFGFRDYFTFQKRNDYQISVQRKEYYQLPGSWNSANFVIGTQDRGRTVFSSSAEETWTLRTRYLEDYEYEFLKNLFLSNDVRIRQSGSNDFYPAVITSANYTERTERKNKLFQFEIQVKMANNLNTQRG